MENNEELSPMEIALQFIDEHPTLIGKAEGEAFQAFWDHPAKVIKLFNTSLEWLSHQSYIDAETTEQMKPDLLVDACMEYVNLNTEE